MIADRYELGRELGRGGMGAVWLATDTVLGREVALKRVGLVPGGASPDLDRAEREARLAARLTHPHVVAVFDLVVDDGSQWLVMEYVDGVTLSGLVLRDGALTPDEAAPVVRQVADALTAAHEAGIVHRDVKPSNILVTVDGQAKLSDFGIAKATADATLTQTGLVTGSPAYLSPEVAAGNLATTASDVWSLGATLYHALTGHPPYEVKDNVMGALYRIVNEPPPRPEQAGWLMPLFEATMTHDPEARWSMVQVRDFLDGAPSQTVIHPMPQSAAERRAESTQLLETPEQGLPPATPGGTPVTTPADEPAHATPQEPTPVPPPTTAVAAEPVEDDRPRRGVLAALPWVLGVLALLLVAWVIWQALDTGDGQRPEAGDTSSPSSSADGAGGNGGGSGSADEPTAAGMRSFIRDYLATAPSDPDTTFEELTPSFQEASGGIDGYTGYWNTIESAEPLSIEPDPESLVVSYTAHYVRENGTEVDDSTTLQLVFRDGDYLIDGES